MDFRIEEDPTQPVVAQNLQRQRRDIFHQRRGPTVDRCECNDLRPVKQTSKRLMRENVPVSIQGLLALVTPHRSELGQLTGATEKQPAGPATVDLSTVYVNKDQSIYSAGRPPSLLLAESEGRGKLNGNRNGKQSGDMSST